LIADGLPGSQPEDAVLTGTRLSSGLHHAGARPMQRNCFVVLGMHRSGTSALALALGLLGVELPRSRMGGDQWNAAGYAESLAFYSLNERILSAAGTKWDDWREINPNWHLLPAAVELRKEAVSTLESEYDAARPFIIKDPRICRLTRFWTDVFQEAGVTPVFVLPIRNPMEVAASLHHRDGIEPWLSHLLWMRHVIDAEHATRGEPRVFTSYDGLMADWRRVAQRIASTLNVPWPRPVNEAAAQIDAMLSESRRHHLATLESLRGNPKSPAGLVELFEIADHWACEGESFRDYTALDRIKTEFDGASSAFAGLIRGAEDAIQRARRLEADLIATRAQLADREAAIKEHVRENTELRARWPNPIVDWLKRMI
jgi:hypothetical protein